MFLKIISRNQFNIINSEKINYENQKIYEKIL